MIVYRRGPATAKNFTPRPGTDTYALPGKAPGLSVWDTVQLAKKEKAQVLDLTLLKPPLTAFPDDPSDGGDAGHFAIAPVNEYGDIDDEALDDWAAARDSGQVHPLTLLVRDAITGELRG